MKLFKIMALLRLLLLMAALAGGSVLTVHANPTNSSVVSRNEKEDDDEDEDEDEDEEDDDN